MLDGVKEMGWLRLETPTSLENGFDPNVSSRSHVASVLDDVRFSLYLDLARSPRSHSLQIIDDEGHAGVLEDVLVLHGVPYVAAANIDVFAVRVKAHGGHVRSSSLGSGCDPAEGLGLQILLLFFREQYWHEGRDRDCACIRLSHKKYGSKKKEDLGFALSIGLETH